MPRTCKLCDLFPSPEKQCGFYDLTDYCEHMGWDPKPAKVAASP